MSTIRVKKLNDNAVIPTRGSEYAAGYDLYSCIDEDLYIPSGKTKKIGTGIAMEIPHGYFGAIYARSGLATKKGLRLANSVGVIDEDYRGEIIVPIFNDSNFGETIKPGERIAQLIIQKYEEADFVETEELNDTKRKAGGFGSTGIN